MKAETTRLQWRGGEAIVSLREAIAQRANVEIELPADFHHAVSSRLKPDLPPAHGQRLEVSGGAELLVQVAGIAGLSALAAFQDPVSRACARVRVVSPAPTICISFKEARASR
jgi:hypothetical protein